MENKKFEAAQRFAALISKEYAREFLRLLIIYKNISASEAAARLELHIKTAQDFLEGLEKAGIVDKRKAGEKKRPYFRYSLQMKEICIEIDLGSLYDPIAYSSWQELCIREKKNSGAMFKEGQDERISSVHIFQGKGRSRVERKLSLTEAQGRFLFHLPFPTEAPLSVAEICKKAGLKEDYLPEIFDLIEVLIKKQVISEEKE